MENYVDVLNVTQSFHGRKVLDNVTVSFCEGKIHGVIGNNGSGKTVLFKTICGFLTPQKGEVYVRGQRVGKDFDFPCIEFKKYLSHTRGEKGCSCTQQGS